MNSKQEYINLIIDKLKSTINPYKVILFGSFAYGKPTKDSDIDIIVVTNDDFMPKNHREKSELYLKVSNSLTEIIGQIPIDIIVYSKPMYKKFIELSSMFSKKILKNGKVLYERNDQ